MEEAGDLLQAWGLVDLIPQFMENAINLHSLAALTLEDKELIPQLGPRALFLRCWKNWQSEYNTRNNLNLSASDLNCEITLSDINFETESETQVISLLDCTAASETPLTPKKTVRATYTSPATFTASAISTEPSTSRVAELPRTSPPKINIIVENNSVIGALGRMLHTGALTDVTLSASGTSMKAHRLVLASCSQYFAQLFKEVESENNTLVVVLSCDANELSLLLTFMYTGEVTASKKVLPSLLRLAQTLKVSGLTDADTNSTLTSTEPETPQEENTSNSPINLEQKHNITEKPFLNTDTSNSSSKQDDVISPIEPGGIDFAARNERDRLSKLDQIVQNLYSTHKIGNPVIAASVAPSLSGLVEDPYERKYRINSSVCTICNKRLSNQYNLRVHMETHAGRRHACRACSHVSRSRDALRKHVAYRHARADMQRGDL